jgi:autotransporter-associated beta strand protein
LNGGTLAVGSFIFSTPSGTRPFAIHLNGGTLKANSSTTAFLPVFTDTAVDVDSGGAVINPNGQAITIAAPLVHGTGTPDGGLTLNGAGTLTLTGNNTYTGPTTISAGILALSGSGSIASTRNINIGNGAIFDVSGLSGGFNLATSQTLSNSVATTGILSGNVNTGTGTNSVTFVDGTPAFAVTNGTLTLASNTVFRINNTGSPLGFGSHKLIAKITAGTPGAVAAVSSLVPTNVVVTGAGAVSGVALEIVGGELYLNVGATTVALVSSAQNNGHNASITFTASVQTNSVTAGDATGTVQFVTNGVAFGAPVGLTAGVVSTNLSTLPRGTNVITAVYSGDVNYLTSSNSLNEIITNLPPVANPNTYSRNHSLTWRISVANLLTNVTDADTSATLTLSFGSPSVNGVTLDTTTFPGYVAYYNPNLVDDQFTYTVTDAYGASSSAAITLTIASAGGGVSGQQFTSYGLTNGYPLLTFATIPGYTNYVQVSSNLGANAWTTIWTNTTGGVFQFIDSNAPSPAFYRLMWNGQ